MKTKKQFFSVALFYSMVLSAFAAPVAFAATPVDSLTELRDLWESSSLKCTTAVYTANPKIKDDQPMRVTVKNPVITKEIDSNGNCILNYDYDKGDPKNAYSNLTAFGDSILFSALLCDSDIVKYGWACDAIAESQADNGRFYRTAFAKVFETEKEKQGIITQNSFSSDHTIGVLLFLLAQKRRDDLHLQKQNGTDIAVTAVTAANKFWNYINQRKEGQNYRVCPRDTRPSQNIPGYCDFGADGYLVSNIRNGELALFKLVYDYIGADSRKMFTLDVTYKNLLPSFNSTNTLPETPDDVYPYENSWWQSCSVNPFSCHLASTIDLILKRTQTLPVDPTKKLPILIEGSPLTRKSFFDARPDNAFLQWAIAAAPKKSLLIPGFSNKTAFDSATKVYNICKSTYQPKQSLLQQDWIWEKSNSDINGGQLNPEGWACVSMLTQMINNYDNDVVNYCNKTNPSDNTCR